jgi:transposase
MRAHHSRLAKAAYDKLNIFPIFSLPYSPQFNGIESVFSIAKANYKRELLRAVLKGERLQPKAMINHAIQSLDREKISACLRHGMSEIECLRLKIN